MRQQGQSQTLIASQKADTITIEESRETKLTSDSASIQVAIRGSALFSGSSAFKKAKEVAELMEALGDIGVEPRSMTT